MREHQLLLLVVEPVPLAQQRRDEALHAGQRRAQLVRHRRHEVGAVAVEPGTTASRADHQRRRSRPVRSAAARLIRPVTSTSVPLAVSHDCSVRPTRLPEAFVRRVGGVPVAALLVLQRDHLAEVTAGDRDRPEQPARHLVHHGDHAVGVGDHDPVGEGVEQSQRRRDPRRQRRSPAGYDDLTASGSGRQLEVGQGLEGAGPGEVPARPAVLLRRRVTEEHRPPARAVAPPASGRRPC